ncbi:hypothetical protein [uncultured Eubacterium sp.]|uniref:hypothetical protein n=1 Tax=uncultured Eubacterium sp. TaxID=165185 RepID=UPI002596B3A5|nr:hypothetical protein [uncultured Eubacterium sp.]
MINFKVIDCKNYIYISNNNKYYCNLSGYLFDGNKAEITNREEWYRLDKIPTVVSEKQPNKRINERYELKVGYTPNDLMPKVIIKDQIDEYEEVIGLYTYKYDSVPGNYEEIEFSIEKIYEREDFEFVPNKYNAETDLITQIEYPEEAYQDKPCRIDSSHMFELIREYVKAHIDTSVATIKSDYKFHFEVSKKIALANPYSIRVDENNSLFNRKRKPKWVDRMISNKETIIINFKDKESTNDIGDDCRVAPSITGKNYIDLQNKIENYLSELMKQINKKYCECSNCKGWGVVEVEE